MTPSSSTQAQSSPDQHFAHTEMEGAITAPTESAREAGYMQRAYSIWDRAVQLSSVDGESMDHLRPTQLVQWFVTHASQHWSASTLGSYKTALTYMLHARSQGPANTPAEKAEVAEFLQAYYALCSNRGMKHTPSITNAQRRKLVEIPEAHVRKLSDALRKTRSKWAHHTDTWLLANLVVGLRVKEWQEAYLHPTPGIGVGFVLFAPDTVKSHEDETPAFKTLAAAQEAAMSNGTPIPASTFEIHSKSKPTSTVGPTFREVPIPDQEGLAYVRAHLNNIATWRADYATLHADEDEEKPDHWWTRFHAQCRKVLYDTCSQIFTNPELTYSLSATRAQHRADALSNRSASSIATSMGHSATTGRASYGKRSGSRFGGRRQLAHRARSATGEIMDAPVDTSVEGMSNDDFAGSAPIDGGPGGMIP